MTRVLVTGAAGFIGSHLAEALVRRGDEVIGVDNFDPFYPRDMKERNLAEADGLERYTFREQDMLDVAALEPLLTPDTVVVHLAAKAGVRPSLADPVGYARANVTGTAAVVEASRRAGVSRFVFGSSSSVYGDSTPVPFREDAVAIEPVSPYAATKRAGELFLHSVAPLYRLRTASLRFFTVYGPRQRPDMAFHRFLKAARDGEAVRVYGDGRQTRDFTYIGDIVAATRAAADSGRPGCVNNVGGGERVSVNEVLEMVEQVTGRKPPVVREQAQKGDVRDTSADTSAARRDLGFASTVPLREGLAREWAWIQEAR